MAALRRSVKDVSQLGPLAVVAWVKGIDGWNSEIPGNPGSKLLLVKNATGIDGFVHLESTTIKLDSSSPSRAAASILAFLSPESIPLFKSQVEQDVGGKLQKVVERLVTAELAKSFDKPGATAAPRAPLAPVGQQTPTATQTAKPSVSLPKPKPPTPQGAPKLGTPSIQKKAEVDPAKKIKVKLTKAEIEATCPSCGGVEFEGGRFIGCLCFRDYAHQVQLRKADSGYEMQTALDPDFVRALLGVLKRRK